MAERRYYRVGGQVFSVTAEESLFELMNNYQPFACEPCGTIFDVVESEVPIPDKKTHVFTDSSDIDMPRIEIYRVGEKWLFMMSRTKESDICLHIEVSADMREVRMQSLDTDRRFGIDNTCMLLYAFTTAPLHTLLMHAAVIERQGKGVLFLGHSGTGKSTHARMWLQAFDNASLLNDDNPVLRITDSGEIRVYGSPWSGKTACYFNRDVPVAGIVQLVQAPANRIQPLRLPEAYAAMLSSCSGMKFLTSMMDALYTTLSTIIQTIRVYRLECLPDTDAAIVCARQINF